MNYRQSYALVSALMLVLSGSRASAKNEAVTLKIPPSTIRLNIGNQPIAVVASGAVRIAERGHDSYSLDLELSADLSDLQQNLTPVLEAALNKNESCGDRLTILNAVLAPDPPSARVLVQLHYERYVCFKAFGKQQSKKALGGNGTIQMRLTPTIQDNKMILLVPEVESIQADGTLGELLRAGSISDKIRDKINSAVQGALQKGTDRSLTLPPAVQDIAVIEKAEFRDLGAGRLAVVLGGEAQISGKQTELLKNQLKERLGR
jgi:hypothetical protein